MLNKHLRACVVSLVIWTYPCLVFGQESAPFSCFNAQEVVFPLSENDFSESKVLANDEAHNALYYVYQDKYTFWYKFIVKKSGSIQFAVSPTNDTDRYRAVAYRHDGGDFCDQLVNFDLDPYPLKRAPLMVPDEKVVYLNTIEAAAGDTFFISVLSLNKEDCGHFLKMVHEGEELSIHAIHKPCYKFGYLEMPEFTAAKEYPADVSLFLRDLETTAGPTGTPEPNPEMNTVGFGSIQTIEVQSAEDGLVSVGDKLILNKVFFYNNTYAFKPDAEEELGQLFNFLQDNPTVEIEIHGHSANNNDDIRPDPNFKGLGPEWNFKGSAFKLSEMRAEAVKQYLIGKGIKKKRLAAIGFGDTQKRVVDASSFEDFEKNMRVEALVIKQ